MDFKDFVDLTQSLGIIIGFAVTIWQLRDSAKLRRFDVYWRIRESHRETWRPLLEDPSLGRVRDPAPDLLQSPITEAERFFVIGVMLHIEGAFHADQAGYHVISPQGMRDIGSFFHLPIPQRVWDGAKEFQTPDFTSFIERLRAAVLPR